MPPHRRGPIVCRPSLRLLLPLLLLSGCWVRTLSAPAPRDARVFSLTAACDTDDELLDLCQRCAKLTRSPLALGSCCSPDLLARAFCNDYVYFARSGHDFY